MQVDSKSGIVHSFWNRWFAYFKNVLLDATSFQLLMSCDMWTLALFTASVLFIGLFSQWLDKLKWLGTT
jgi:hypothetical protein